MKPESRPVFLAGNWKMFHGPQETAAFLSALKLPALDPRLGVMIAPPAISLESARRALGEASQPALGCQNLHWEKNGAFTGEISGPMAKELGVGYAILGHSERRHLFAESDAMINQRLLGALREGLQPILCIGETLDQREANQTEAVLERQLGEGLKGANASELGEKLLIAYEPVWAIGTGKTATPEIAQSAHVFTRNFLASMYNTALAESTPILYGGSVKPENFADLLAETDVDGGLVGGASLKAESFQALAEIAQQALAAR